MSGFPNRVRDIITRRADGACERCGLASPAYQHHHRRPRGMGGSSADDTNTPANALVLCIECHRYVEDNREEALFAGWLVRQGHDPATVPVVRCGEWVLLGTDGAVVAR